MVAPCSRLEATAERSSSARAQRGRASERSGGWRAQKVWCDARARSARFFCVMTRNRAHARTSTCAIECHCSLFEASLVVRVLGGFAVRLSYPFAADAGVATWAYPVTHSCLIPRPRHYISRVSFQPPSFSRTISWNTNGCSACVAL